MDKNEFVNRIERSDSYILDHTIQQKQEKQDNKQAHNLSVNNR